MNSKSYSRNDMILDFCENVFDSHNNIVFDFDAALSHDRIYKIISEAGNSEDSAILRHFSLVDDESKSLNKFALNRYLNKLSLSDPIISIGVALISIDELDRFSRFYSAYKTTEAIKAVSQRIMDTIERFGLYLFRLSTDKFVVFYPKSSITSLSLLCKEINSGVRNIKHGRDDGSRYNILTVTIAGTFYDSDSPQLFEFQTSLSNQLAIASSGNSNCYVIDNKIYEILDIEKNENIDYDFSDIKKSTEKQLTLSGRNKSLIVDDIDMNREILSDMLEDTYEILEAVDGIDALEQLSQNIDSISVVLLDINMPRLDGIGVLKAMQERGWLNLVPVIIISADKDNESECLENGASDFIHKPFDDFIVKLRVFNTIERYIYKNNLEKTVNTQMKLLEQRNTELMNMNDRIIELLGNIVEARNLESGTHIKRVKDYTRILAMSLMDNFPAYNITKDIVELITTSSALHDIGKIMIKDDILTKPGKLTAEEFEHIKTHTLLGKTVLESSKALFDEDNYIYGCEIALYHHEKFDGKGYPMGLKGNDIPISAQIVSIADCFDALVSKRSYKEPFTPQQAYDMIVTGQCGAFNPDLIKCFTLCKSKFEDVINNTIPDTI